MYCTFLYNSEIKLTNIKFWGIARLSGRCKFCRETVSILFLSLAHPFGSRHWLCPCMIVFVLNDTVCISAGVHMS